MKIYEFYNANAQAYLYAPDEICRPCEPDPPRPIGAGWMPPTFELVQSDEFRSFLPKTDFITYSATVIVLSARAVGCLRAIAQASGEILPIQLSNDPDTLYLLNVTRIINAVDMERSRFLRFDSGGIMKVERLVFDSTKLPTEAVFFKNTQMGACTEIFATEAAVQAVERANLTGHAFELVWSDE